MLFKSFSHISRHAALAKTLWTTTTSSNHSTAQPTFFVSTSQLARQQSQVATRQSSASFGHGGERHYSAHTSACAGLSSASSFSTIVPLSSLDDEKQRDVLHTAVITSDAASRSKALANSSSSSKLLNRGRSFSQPTGRRRYSTTKGTQNGDEQSANGAPDAEATADEKPRHRQQAVRYDENAIETNEAVEAIEGQQPDQSMEQVRAKENTDVEPLELSPKSTVQTVTKEAAAPIEAEPQPFESELHTSPGQQPITQVLPKEVLDFLESKTSQLHQQFTQGNHSGVTKIFDEIRSNQVVPASRVYHTVLQSLAIMSAPASGDMCYDLTGMLDVYSDMVNNGVAPSTDTYILVMNALLDAADYASRQIESNFLVSGLRARHVDTLSASSAELLDAVDRSFAYVTIAADIFEASNAAKSRRYPASLLMRLLSGVVRHGRSDKLPYVLDSFDSWKYGNAYKEALPSIVKGMGQLSDVEAAKKYYESFIQDMDNVSINEEFNVYASLIEALFSSGDELGAVVFFQSILNDKEKVQDGLRSDAFRSLLAAMIDGWLSRNDHLSAWEWIREMDADRSVPSIPFKSLIKSFSAACAAGDLDTAGQMFDFVAAQKDSTRYAQFNTVRCDYAMLGVRKGDVKAVHKVVKETYLRNGLFEPSTLVQVFKFLVDQGQADLAVEVAVNQAERLFGSLASNREWEVIAEDVVSSLVRVVFHNDSCLLSLSELLSLASSHFMTKRSFADNASAGIRILQCIWSHKRQNTTEYKQLQMSSQASLITVIALHNVWVLTAAASNSIGELSIPTSTLNELKDNYRLFVDEVMARGLSVDIAMSQEIVRVLRLLEDQELSAKFNEWANQYTGRGPVSQPTESADAAPAAVVDHDASREIIGYAQMKDGIYSAYEKFGSVLMRGALVTPQAAISVIDAAGSSRSSDILFKCYDLCLKYLPHPATSYNNWETWVSIHRIMVHYGAELNYPLAITAYRSLLDMNSCPDVAGYGQLIAHAPHSHTHDEASDSLRLFNEAKSFGLVPTTFLYNVVLSKLSKARRLKEAQYYYSEMERLGVKKSSVTYGTMISACCRAGDEQYARRLFSEMEKSSSYVPKVAPFNTMLQYYVHTKRDRSEALNVYSKMRDLNVTPSAHTYKLLIDMYSMIEPIDIRAADKVLIDIVNDGNKITCQHYAALIYARGVCARNVESALDFYQSMLFRRRAYPDRVVFQAVLESLVTNGAIHKTGSVLAEMVKYNVELDAYMANTLIRGWASENLAKSVALFQHILSAGKAEPSSFESIIRAFMFNGDVKSAKEVLNTMKSVGYPEPVISKVDTLISKLRSEHSKDKETMLLDSIFRHEALQLGEESHKSDDEQRVFHTSSASNIAHQTTI